MIELALTLTFAALGYLLGMIPTGFLVARWRGVDIRTVGSGNIGVTNVLRSVGPYAALAVAVIDPLKGVVAVLLPSLLGMPGWIVAITAFMAVLGNTYNVLLRWRGGKGVATVFGVFLVVDPVATLLAAAVFAVTVVTGRLVSLGSIVAVCSGPLFVVARGDAPLVTVVLAFALAALVVWRHRDNVARLRTGTERRLGEPRHATPPATVPRGRSDAVHEPSEVERS